MSNLNCMSMRQHLLAIAFPPLPTPFLTMTQVSVDLAPETESARRKLSLRIEADARARSRDWSERTTMLLNMRDETPHRVSGARLGVVLLARQC